MTDKFKIILLIITVIIAIVLSFFIGLIVGQKTVQKGESTPTEKIIALDKNIERSETPKNSRPIEENEKNDTVKPNTENKNTDGSSKASGLDKTNQTTDTRNDQALYGNNTIGKLLSIKGYSSPNKSDRISSENNEFSFQPSNLGSSSVPISSVSPSYSISTVEPVGRYLVQKQINRLSSLGFPAYEVNILNGGKSLYLMRIGRYGTRNDAEKAVRNLPNDYRSKLQIVRVSRQAGGNPSIPVKKNGS